MLKFIKHNMSEIVGVEIYPIISLLIFVTFFAIVLWRLAKMPKSESEKFSQIPLKEENAAEDYQHTKE